MSSTAVQLKEDALLILNKYPGKFASDKIKPMQMKLQKKHSDIDYDKIKHILENSLHDVKAGNL